MKAVIILNGDFENSNKLKATINDADLIIVADGGGNIAYKNNIIPNYIIGDLDSISTEALEYFSKLNVRIEKYSKEKDYTDGELSLNKALEKGADEIVFLAAIGNRLDHSLGNINLLYKAAKKGIKSLIVSENEEIYICSDKLEVKGNIGDTISILSLNGDVEEITLKGFKYPLNNANFKFGDVFGVCNELISHIGEIKVKKGDLIVIKQFNI